MTSSIDVLIVFYNSERFVAPLFRSLRRITIPITLYCLDNGSKDHTAGEVAAELSKVAFPVYFFRSQTNNGFARGVNLLAHQGDGEFLFLLNPDSEIQDGCLEKLLERMQSHSQIGICEARQAPREHPKTYNSETGETTWCSGAASLVRRKAFEQFGGFDERLFFMYCEDVDLSWKFWHSGWKCVYVPGAVSQHFTQDLSPNKSRFRENYFTFRNSLFLYYRFGSWDGHSLCWQFLWKRLLCSKYTLRSRFLFTIAFIDHIRYIPYLLNTRHSWSDRKHPWVRLEETSLAG